MSYTTEIPSTIQQLSHVGFRNVFEYRAAGINPFMDAEHPNLWGTESLAGDWSGRLLIVLKDFAPTEDLERRTDGRPLYSHRPDFRTNQNLVALLAAAGIKLELNGQTRASCGIVIASACFLLRKGDNRSAGDLPKSVLAANWPALEFTITSMPNLTDIVLCGVDAFDTFQNNGNLKGERRAIQSSRTPVSWRTYRVHCTSHTQPTAINTRKDSSAPNLSGWQVAVKDWRAICRHAASPTAT